MCRAIPSSVSPCTSNNRTIWTRNYGVYIFNFTSISPLFGLLSGRLDKNEATSPSNEYGFELCSARQTADVRTRPDPGIYIFSDGWTFIKIRICDSDLPSSCILLKRKVDERGFIK